MSEGTILGDPGQSDPHDVRLAFLVPKLHVKAVKSALENHKKFHRRHGIHPENSDNEHKRAGREQRMLVPTTISPALKDDEASLDLRKHTLLAELQLSHLSPAITLSSWNASDIKKRVTLAPNPLHKALREALEALPPGTLASLDQPCYTTDVLVSVFPESYSVYHPLLLISSNSLNTPWPTLLSNHPSLLQPVWAHVAQALNCTHIALNSPIPPSNKPSSAHARDSENILRSPVNLTPIYGSFGPSPTSQTLSEPSQQDFKDALWVRTTQNGIHQTWAPQYTMFSRGNVKEKARILHLPSLSSNTTTKGRMTAVDMYAGIGYFSFSYLKAGAARVLCWELNPWSIEGLRRGAALNNWTTRLFTPADIPSQHAGEPEWNAWREAVVTRDDDDDDDDFCVFAMSNETAHGILKCLGGFVPPIRHVNLGLLPLSRASWPSAVRAVDKRLGGWVHAHENVGVEEMDERRVEVEAEFQRLIDERAGGNESAGRDAEGGKRKVQVEHVERVKMYAPGVVHAVFDVYIPGTQAAE